MKKVSIIVPNYNTEKYISTCIESLIKQTYSNIEIIIVDDCSKDNSIKIIKKYQEEHDNIILIELKENQGVSKARNKGIQAATGEYIMFSDSDDWYELHAVETLVKTAKEKNADFITANYYINKDNKKIKVNTTNYFSKEQIKKEEIISYMTLTSCSKLIKRELFIKNNIWYPENTKRCEELMVIPVLAYLASNPIAIENALYNYYQRKGSASNSDPKDIDYFKTTFEGFVKFLDEEKYKEEIEFRAIEHFLYSQTLVMIKAKFSNEELKKHINEFKDKYKGFNKNKYLSNFSKIKTLFIKTVIHKCFLLARIFVEIHKKITA